jgi:hypothetical protein
VGKSKLRLAVPRGVAWRDGPCRNATAGSRVTRDAMNRTGIAPNPGESRWSCGSSLPRQPAAIAVWLLLVAPALSTASDVVTVDNACDMLVSAEQAPPGTLIVLAGPPVHLCQVVLDASRREVRSGQGITIQADWVTFDLNGRVCTLRCCAGSRRVFRPRRRGGC